MKKLAIRLAIAAAIATSGTISNVAFADTTPKNGATQGLKHGLKNGLKNGARHGAKNGLKHGLKYGAKHGAKNGAKEGLKNGDRKSGDFLPFYGAANGATIAKFPVTNSEYDAFVRTTKHTPPRYWKDNSFPKGKGRHPVLWVSFNDASAYCEWLGAKDASHTYRLPTEAEWESAAGDRPHDAQFNFNGVVASHLLNENPSRAVTFIHPKSEYNGKSSPLAEVISISPDGRRVQGWANHRNHTGFIYTDLFTTINEAGGFTTAVDTYSETKSACGALDMWGNCWEWTSTEIIAQNGAERGKKVNAIKGGSWYANRNSCTTSYRGEGRNPNGCYNTVGFRVVKEPRSRNVLK